MSSSYDEYSVVEMLQDRSTVKKGFAMAVQQYSQPLYWQIRRLVLNHDDANDILQNTFMKAWSSIHLFRGEARLSTWLYRIALNECLTFLNKEKARNTVSIDDPEASALNTLESDAYFCGNEIEKRFMAAQETLPPKQRMVFNLRYYDEMTFTEISEIMGTSVGALKADYHHAAKKIKAYLEQND